MMIRCYLKQGYWWIHFCELKDTEKTMAPHSSTLAWKIPRAEEPGRLQSMGLLGVGHDWATSLSLFTFMHWRRKWQPTPVFLPGESQGRGSLVGCRLWGCTESDTTESDLAAAADNLWVHSLMFQIFPLVLLFYGLIWCIQNPFTEFCYAQGYLVDNLESRIHLNQF